MENHTFPQAYATSENVATEQTQNLFYQQQFLNV